MTEDVQKLAHLAFHLVQEKITPTEYVKAHKDIVFQIISSWNNSKLIQRYVDKLLYYYLADSIRKDTKDIISRTHEYIKGETTEEEYAHHLRSAFAVLNKLNSVPLDCGIRVRQGNDIYSFFPIIRKGKVVNPDTFHPENFRTSIEQQEEVQIEVYIGYGSSVRSPDLKKLLQVPLHLPKGLRKGEVVIVTIGRIGDTDMRVTIYVPNCGQSSFRKAEIQDGFRKLTEGLEADQSLYLKCCTKTLAKI